MQQVFNHKWVLKGLFFIIVLIVLASFEITANAVPANPNPKKETQADGSEITIIGRGDEFFNWVEDENGYIIAYDTDSENWCYAYIDNGKILPSEVIVGEIDLDAFAPFSAPMQKLTIDDLMHLIINVDTNAHTTAIPEGEEVNEIALSPAFYSSSLITSTTLFPILIEFNDATLTHSIQYWHNHFFGTTDHTLNGYFAEVSAGQYQFSAATFTVSNRTITTGLPAGVSEIELYNGVARVRLTANHPRYLDDNRDYIRLETEIQKAYEAVKGYVNFSAFGSKLLRNHIRCTDFAVYTVVAGWERSGNPSQAVSVWAHAMNWSYDGINVSVNFNNKNLQSYATQGEIYSGPMNSTAIPMGIGVSVHELFHTLGLPDLYSYIGGAGIGYYSIMASGSWGQAQTGIAGYSPTHPDAWSKVELGYVIPTVISNLEYGVFSVRNFSSNPAKSHDIIKVINPVNPNQYFLIENRQAVGYDAGMYGRSSTTGGVLIYHVDETIRTYRNNYNVNDNNLHKMVEVERFPANSFDPYYRVGSVTSFTDLTAPSSRFHNTRSNTHVAKSHADCCPQIIETGIDIFINSESGPSMDVVVRPEGFSQKISLSKTGLYTYPEATFGYGARAAETITIRNTGSFIIRAGYLNISLSGDDSDKFTLSALTNENNIPVGGNRPFTIRPVTDLTAGTYIATVTVSGEEVAASQSFYIAFTVNKRTGAALRADPAVNTASRAPTKLTVSNVTSIVPNSNPGAQTMQYAITTSSSASMPSTLVWKNFAEGETVSFDGLRPSTRYYIWARTAANENCNAGTARRSAEIRTPAPVQAISLNRSGTQRISAAQLGYTAPASLSVRVNSIGTAASGDLKIELSGLNPDSFELSGAALLADDKLESIAKNNNTAFTIRPVTGLAAGTYTATVKVSGTDGSEAAEQSFIVSFTVNRNPGTPLSSTQIPRLSPEAGSLTHESITVTPPVPSPSSTDQELQYAITASTSSTAPTGGWQDSPVFDELDAATNYRVWARFAQNDSYDAGTARRSAEIRTQAKEYQVTLSTKGHTFASSAKFGANPPKALTVTVNNKGQSPSGELTATLSGSGAEYFTLGGNALSKDNKLLSIAGHSEGRGGSRTFTVRPKTNVPVSDEPYTATVTVSGGEGANAFEIDFDVSFSVRGPGTGAKLRAAPRAARTDTSITVTNHLNQFPINHPGAQSEVQYAITTSSSSKMPSGLVWRTFPEGDEDIIFENLRSNTNYYIWARTVANKNCNAGTARRSSAIKTQTPAHGVILNRAGTHTFATTGLGENPPSALSVTVSSRNRASGDLTVKIIDGDIEAFELRGNAAGGMLKSISKGGSRTFNVRPAFWLDMGEYSAKVVISGINTATSAPFEVSFNISYSIGLEAGAPVNSVPFAKEVTADSITVIPVLISGINPGGQKVEYTISTSSLTTAAAIAELDKQDKWQRTLEFTGLEPSTTYYVFARSEANETHYAGVVRRSAAIRTDVADYVRE